MLSNGSTGDAVKSLQENLETLGFNPGPIDGIFGPKTEAAVRGFQGSVKIQVDGIVGPETTGALKHAMVRAAKQEKPGGPAVTGGYVPPTEEAAKDDKEKG